jgi:hypothetical protein
MIQAFKYHGLTFVKFGRKATPGVMYLEKNARAGKRPDVELWRDGTITYMDRPEGEITEMRRVRLPLWVYRYDLKKFKPRS